MCTHVFVIGEHDVGVCKLCGKTKQFHAVKDWDAKMAKFHARIEKTEMYLQSRKDYVKI